MGQRLQRAVSLSVRVGFYAAAFGLLNVLLRGSRLSATRFALFLVVVPVGSFLLYFGLVFPLAYAFPPTTDKISGRLSFPGARWVVWPLVGILTAGTLYFVLSRR